MSPPLPFNRTQGHLGKNKFLWKQQFAEHPLVYCTDMMQGVYSETLQAIMLRTPHRLDDRFCSTNL